MIICLETWQAAIVAVLLALVFAWAGFATSKVFLFSERDIKQRKTIRSLEMLVNHLQNVPFDIFDEDSFEQKTKED